MISAGATVRVHGDTSASISHTTTDISTEHPASSLPSIGDKAEMWELLFDNGEGEYTTWEGSKECDDGGGVSEKTVENSQQHNNHSEDGEERMTDGGTQYLQWDYLLASKRSILSIACPTLLSAAESCYNLSWQASHTDASQRAAGDGLVQASALLTQ